jgi:hypothetical protein
MSAGRCSRQIGGFALRRARAAFFDATFVLGGACLWNPSGFVLHWRVSRDAVREHLGGFVLRSGDQRSDPEETSGPGMGQCRA